MKVKSVKLLKIDGVFSSYKLTLDSDEVLHVPNDVSDLPWKIEGRFPSPIASA